jgi:hypothetical protein
MHADRIDGKVLVEALRCTVSGVRSLIFDKATFRAIFVIFILVGDGTDMIACADGEMEEIVRSASSHIHEQFCDDRHKFHD